MKMDMFVFDMAGTTVDDSGNFVAEALCAAMIAAGVPTTHAQIDPVMGMPKPEAVRSLLRDARGSEPTDAEVMRIHAEFQNRMVDFYRSAPGVKEIPGASDLFRTLKSKGVRVTLDTGFDRRILDTIVERLGWKDLIDDSAASDEVSRGRPDPELIHVLMKRAGVTDPKRVAKFGDSLSDIEQGLAAGCGFVGAILTSRTRPIVHMFPTVKPMDSIAQALDIMEEAGCAPFSE